MKTSILKSLLILTTLVIPLVTAPLLAHKHNGGKKDKNYPIVDIDVGAFYTDGSLERLPMDFTISKDPHQTLHIKYRLETVYNEDTKACNKRSNKVSKRLQRVKFHKKTWTLIKHRKTKLSWNSKCTVKSVEFKLAKIINGTLGTITDTPPEPEITPEVMVSSAEIIEGDDAQVMLEFKVKMKGKHKNRMRVKFKSYGKTAKVHEDFVDTEGELEFEATESEEEFTKTVQVPVIGDLIVEEDETLELATTLMVEEVAEPTVMTMARIIDNDVVPTLSNADQLKNLRQTVYTEAELRFPGTGWTVPISGLDLEGDGDEDIIVIYALPYDNNVGELVIYRNDNTTESGWIVEPTGVMTNAGPNSMLVGDFNGDGLDDVFIVNPYYTDNHMALMQVDGSLVNSTVGEQRLGAYGSKGYNNRIGTSAIGDLDMDGDLDIYIIGQSDPQGRYTHGDITYINDGAGNFVAEHRTNRTYRTIQYQWKVSAEIGDFNGDGINEIFIGTNGYDMKEGDRAGQYSHIFGNNNMLMGADGEIMDSAVPRVANDVCDACDQVYATISDVKAIDINGDGWMDVVTQSSDTSAGNEVNARIDIYLGNNDGTFDLSQSLWNGVEMDARLAFEDVNGDGFLDIIGLPARQQQTYFLQKVAADYPLNKDTSTVYINDGGGYFAEDASVTIDQVSILSGMFFLTQDLEYIPTELKQ